MTARLHRMTTTWSTSALVTSTLSVDTNTPATKSSRPEAKSWPEPTSSTTSREKVQETTMTSPPQSTSLSPIPENLPRSQRSATDIRNSSKVMELDHHPPSYLKYSLLSSLLNEAHGKANFPFFVRSWGVSIYCK